MTQVEIYNGNFVSYAPCQWNKKEINVYMLSKAILSLMYIYNLFENFFEINWKNVLVKLFIH